MSGASTSLDRLRREEFLVIDRLPSDEEREIPGGIRGFVEDRVLPNVGDWFEQARVPRELAQELGKLGMLGMPLELEAGDSGIRGLVSVQGSLVMYAIHRWGFEDPKQESLPRTAAGEAIGCFGLVEPDAGSDPTPSPCSHGVATPSPHAIPIGTACGSGRSNPYRRVPLPRCRS